MLVHFVAIAPLALAKNPSPAHLQTSVARRGTPISPVGFSSDDPVLLRYIYDGGELRHGRLCELIPSSPDAATGPEIMACLRAEGVDLDRFRPCVYETLLSTGGWLPIKDEFSLPLAATASSTDGEPPAVSRRIDVKLFPAASCLEANCAEQALTPNGDLPVSGYFGIGVLNSKNQANVGTLWRSAFQLGAQFMFTIGTRYRHAPTDTVRAVQRIPLFECDDWTDFAAFAPRGAKWVAIEMGGTPLEEYEHPLNAVYILGSEDSGLPKSVFRACHDVVSLRAENYASFNVAIAGSLIMYDRQTKERARRAEQELQGAKGAPAAEEEV